jgi:hypothetical protein
MLQSGISGLADPIVARMKEDYLRSESAKGAADALTALNKLYTSQQQPPATPGAAAAPSAPGSPGSTTGNAGGSFAMGQGMDPNTGAPTPGGMGTVPASALLQAGKVGIAGVESGGSKDPYSAEGPVTSSGDRAYGKYQVMGANVPAWTEKYLGVRMTPEEFKANPAAQEKVFEGQFGSYLDRYGNLRDAASMWFSGRPMTAAGTASDGYSTVPQYIAKMEAHIRRQFGSSPVPPPAPQASFAPTVAPAPTPAAAAAVTAPQGQQPAMPLPRRGPTAEGGIPFTPQQGQPQAQQQQAQQQTPQQQQEAQQQQILGTVGQATAQNAQRLDGMRQEAERVRVASLDPSAGMGLPNGGQAAPGAGGQNAALDPSLTAPRVVPTTRFGPDGQPIATPAPPSPAAAPAGTTAGAGGLPPPQPAVASPPYQVAQAQGLPPAVSSQQRGSYDPGVAAALLRNARTPEEVNRIAAALYQQLQPPAPSADRFQIIHDANGNWVRIDRHDRADDADARAAAARPSRPSRSRSERQQVPHAVEPEDRALYDIPVGGGACLCQCGPRRKSSSSRSTSCRDKFESDPETRRYAVANEFVPADAVVGGVTGNGVGDISLIYQYMKMLDPDTGVREGEYANASQTGGIPDRIVNTYNKMVSGERLSDKQRADFVNEAGRLLQVRHSNVVQGGRQGSQQRAPPTSSSPDRVAQDRPLRRSSRGQPPVDPTTGRPRSDPGGDRCRARGDGARIAGQPDPDPGRQGGCRTKDLARSAHRQVVRDARRLGEPEAMTQEEINNLLKAYGTSGEAAPKRPKPRSTTQRIVEGVEDVGRSIQTGLARGVAGAPGMPADLVRLGQAARDYMRSTNIGGPSQGTYAEVRAREDAKREQEQAAVYKPSNLQEYGSQRFIERADEATGGGFIYEPTTAAGRAAALPAEMAGGAMTGGVMGGMRGGARGLVSTAVRSGVVPGAAVTGAKALGVENPVALGAIGVAAGGAAEGARTRSADRQRCEGAARQPRSSSPRPRTCSRRRREQWPAAVSRQRARLHHARAPPTPRACSASSRGRAPGRCGSSTPARPSGSRPRPARRSIRSRRCRRGPRRSARAPRLKCRARSAT